MALNELRSPTHDLGSTASTTPPSVTTCGSQAPACAGTSSTRVLIKLVVRDADLVLSGLPSALRAMGAEQAVIDVERSLSYLVYCDGTVSLAGHHSWPRAGECKPEEGTDEPA